MNIGKDELDGIWEKLYQSSKSGAIAVETVRLDGRPGIEFLASFSGNTIIIQNSRTKKPSTTLSQDRYIGKEEFIKIGLQYEGWRNGTIPRPFIRNQSKNTSYIFGIIDKFKTVKESLE